MVGKSAVKKVGRSLAKGAGKKMVKSVARGAAGAAGNFATQKLLQKVQQVTLGFMGRTVFTITKPQIDVRTTRNVSTAMLDSRWTRSTPTSAGKRSASVVGTWS